MEGSVLGSLCAVHRTTFRDVFSTTSGDGSCGCCGEELGQLINSRPLLHPALAEVQDLLPARLLQSLPPRVRPRAAEASCLSWEEHRFVLMLGLFLYSCWRRHKGLKEGVYHVSAHHGEWEDIRENVLNYDEEGGGEQDQNAFNMVELQRSLQPSPAQSLRYSYPHSIVSYPQTKLPQDNNKKEAPNGSAAIALRLAIPPSETQTLPSPLTFRRSHKTLSFSSQDLARYLCEVIRDMEHPGELGAMTTPRRPSGKERGVAAVRSLSSLSASQGSEVRLQGGQGGRLDRFKTLRAVVCDLRGDPKAPEGQRDKVKESRGQPSCEKSG
ncbi:unnamed protein product [Pleuronectes platessa]|uniref:Uncharacterized protein n=1 Tax=Pleuronectes platessa TaxID=8262 RepID=A0A9N7UVF6_PLEPL|nr:unnamed protein product [Pleuronectes platessa]